MQGQNGLNGTRQVCSFLTLLLILIFSVGRAGTVGLAAEPDLRTWTAASGKSSVEAELLAVRAGKVYLKRKDGVLFSVRPEQLSQEDRDFLDALRRPSDTKQNTASPEADDAEAVAEAIAQCRDACVVIRATVEGGSSRAAAGVFIHRDQTHSYILSSSRLYYRPNPDRPHPDKPAPKYELFYEISEGEFSSLAAEPVGSDGSLAVWRVATKNLPKPLAAKPVKVAAGTKVYVVGRATAEDSSGRDGFAQRAAVVRSGPGVARGSELPTFEIQGEDFADFTLGAVVDGQGQLLGVATRRRSDKTGVANVYPADSLARMLEPRLSSVKLNPLSWNEKGIDYEVALRAVDPFGRIAKATLLVSRGEVPANETPTLTGPDLQSIDLGGLPDAMRAKWGEAGPLTGPWQYRAQLKMQLTDGQIVHSKVVTAQPRFASKDHQIVQLTSPYYGAIAPHASGGIELRWRPTELTDVTDTTTFPKPADDQELLAKAPTELDDARLSSLRSVKGIDDHRGKMQVDYSHDGKYAYFVSTTGELRKVDLPSLKCVRKLQLPTACTYMEVGKGFLVAKTGTHNTGRLWVIDDGTLVVQAAVPIEGHTFALQPEASYVYVLGDGVFRIDLANLKDIRVDTFNDPHARRGSRSPLQSLKFTSDGRVLYSSYRGRLVRIRVEPTGLVPEQFSSEIGASASSMVISKDEKRFACLVRTARLKATDHPQFQQGIYWYNADDLSKPTDAMERDDKKIGIFKNFAKDQGLLSLDGKYRGHVTNITLIGDDKTETPIIKDLPAQNGTLRGVSFHPHPLGGAMILEAGVQVYWITLPSAPESLRAAPQRGDNLLTASKPRNGGTTTPVVSTDAKEFEPLPDWHAGTGKRSKSEEAIALDTEQIEGAELRTVKGWRYMAPTTDDAKWLYLWDRQGRVVKVNAQTWQPDVEIELNRIKSSRLQGGVQTASALMLRFAYEHNSKKPNLVFLDPETLAVKSALNLRFFGPIVRGTQEDQIWILNPSGVRMMSVLNVHDMALEMTIDHFDFTEYIKDTVPGLERLNADWRSEQMIAAGPGRLLWARSNSTVDTLYQFQIHDAALSYVNAVPYGSAAYAGRTAGDPARLVFPVRNGNEHDIAVVALDAPKKKLFSVSGGRGGNGWLDEAGWLYVKTLDKLIVYDEAGKLVKTLDVSDSSLASAGLVHAFAGQRRVILQGSEGLVDLRWQK